MPHGRTWVDRLDAELRSWLRFADVARTSQMMTSTGVKSERSATDQLTPTGVKKSRAATDGDSHDTHESASHGEAPADDAAMSDGEPKGASASSTSSPDVDGGELPSAAEPEGDGAAANVDFPDDEPDAWADPDTTSPMSRSSSSNSPRLLPRNKSAMSSFTLLLLLLLLLLEAPADAAAEP